jgi:hypothetical protein
MKILLLSIIFLTISSMFAKAQTETVSGDITTDTKWTASKIWLLNGFVYVKNNATLTIEPGTIIKGISGTKGALIIERGSKIMAQGTENNPIVFTSDKPAGQRLSGDWGGVVLCGKAITNKADDGAGVGIAEGGIGSKFGGTDNADNSGVLSFVRIEFPGIPLTSTANSEINGLTMYSVGTGTKIDHIQVSYSGDDSYEWFGGSVNCKYLVCIGGLDDEYDTDNGFVGTVQFALGIRDPQIADQSQSNGFESDNDANGSSTTPITKPVFSNVTLLGPLATPTTTINSLFRRAMHIRRGSSLSVYNSLFAGWPIGLIIDKQKGNSDVNAQNNLLQIENVVFAGMTANFETSVDQWTGTTDYFNAATRKNTIFTTNAELKLNDNAFSIEQRNFLPKSDSPLLTGGAFTNTILSSNTFLDKTPAYRGAFGTTDWTKGWTNFNPQKMPYTTPGGVISSVPSMSDVLTKVTSYPNPFSGQTTIYLTLSTSTNVSIDVYSMDGKLVNNLVSRKFAAGNHTFDVDGKLMQKGIYLVKVNTDFGSEIIKLIAQ